MPTQLQRLVLHDETVTESPRTLAMIEALQEIDLRPYVPSAVLWYKLRKTLKHRRYVIQVCIMLAVILLLFASAPTAVISFLVAAIWATLDPAVPSWLVLTSAGSTLSAVLTYWLGDRLNKKSAILDEQWQSIPLHFYHGTIPERIRRIIQRLEPICVEHRWELQIVEWSEERHDFGRFLAMVANDQETTVYLELWEDAA